ncbi:MAG: tetratricopeptide repeat protein, partial [Herbaspirillum sp.]
QNNLGLMYAHGTGVPKDQVQAVTWCRKAAEQGLAAAQNNLGSMYVYGTGVTQNLVAAYALQNLAAARGNQLAVENLKKNEANMSPQDIARAQKLSRQMHESGTVLAPLDAWLKANPARLRPASTSAPVPATRSSSPYPAVPAKRRGVVSCNTSCSNGSCYRTYDSGKKVHFQAKQKFNPFNSQFEWDAGSC